MQGSVLYNPQRFRVGNGIKHESIAGVGGRVTVRGAGCSRKTREIYICRRRVSLTEIEIRPVEPRSA